MVMRGVWRAAGGKPFFANLKVMRAVLRRLEETIGPEGGVRAWVFLEDRFGFVAEGPDTLPDLLGEARRRADEGFRAENREPLWEPGPVGEPVSPERDDAVAELARWPVEAGLAETPEDYPWCGGEWLIR